MYTIYFNSIILAPVNIMPYIHTVCTIQYYCCQLLLLIIIVTILSLLCNLFACDVVIIAGEE